MLFRSVEDIENEDGYLAIISLPNNHHEIREAILTASPEVEIEIDEITWLPLVYQKLTEDQNEQFEKLLELLDDEDDVQKVIHNVEGK